MDQESTKKKQPYPWGYKLYGLSDLYGIEYKIHLYCGAFPQFERFPDIGSTGNRVLSLIENVPRHQDFQWYMDNFFTSITVMNELRKEGIHSIGIICVNNAPGFTKVCMPDKELRELGSRSFVEYL